MIRQNVYFEEELVAKMRADAKKQKISFSKLVRNLIEEKLRRNPILT